MEGQQELKEQDLEKVVHQQEKKEQALEDQEHKQGMEK